MVVLRFNFQSDVHETFIIFDFDMAQSTTYNLDVYQPRNPKASAYYKCVENHFEELECQTSTILSVLLSKTSD